MRYYNQFNNIVFEAEKETEEKVVAVVEKKEENNTVGYNEDNIKNIATEVKNKIWTDNWKEEVIEAIEKELKVEKTYTVKKGDTLTKIARENNTTISKIVEDNKQKYPTITPDLIRTGWELLV